MISWEKSPIPNQYEILNDTVLKTRQRILFFPYRKTKKSLQSILNRLQLPFDPSLAHGMVWSSMWYISRIQAVLNHSPSYRGAASRRGERPSSPSWFFLLRVRKYSVFRRIIELSIYCLPVSLNIGKATIIWIKKQLKQNCSSDFSTSASERLTKIQNNLESKAEYSA